MKELLAYWSWFKADRKAWIAAGASFLAWGVFGVLIAGNEWHVAGDSLLATGAQLACYAYIVYRYLEFERSAEHDKQGVAAVVTGTAPTRQTKGAGWLYSPEAIRLTPPVVALGGFVAVLGALGEFAPNALVLLGGGFSPDFIRFALISGPLLTLVGMRLMLAQSAHR